MNALIIGGTSSLGKYVSEELLNRAAKITTVSRSLNGLENSPHFSCDVADEEKLHNIFLTIKECNPVIDSLWCIAGYAYPRKVEKQTPEVYKKHLDRNITYVQIALSILEESLMKSTHPLVVTFGSQWSYRSASECPELIPYAEAKHALREYTQNFALRNQRIRANHYCIPTCDTLSFRRIEDSLRNMNGLEIMKSHAVLAQPSLVAKKLVEHVLEFKDSGQTMVCQPDGYIQILENMRIKMPQ